MPKQSFQELKKAGVKGEVKRGKGVGDGIGPEGGEGGKNEGNRVGGKGPETILEKL